MLSLLINPFVSSKCISLKESKLCTGMEQYAVMQSTLFTNVQEFDAYIEKHSFDNQTSIETFKQMMECPAFEGQGRFMKSTLCSFVVSEAFQACRAEIPDLAPLMLCSNVCEDSRHSLRDVLANKTLCTTPAKEAAQKSREALFSKGEVSKNLNDFCEALTVNPDAKSESCFKGIETELKMCGFNSIEKKDEFCKIHSKTECCLSPEAIKDEEHGSKEKEIDQVPLGLIIGSIVGVVALAVVAFKVVGYKQSKSHGHDIEHGAKVAPLKFQPNPTIKSSSLDDRLSQFTNARESLIIAPKPAASTDFEARNSLNGTISRIVQCNEDYQGVEEDEIAILVGDIIEVEEDFDDGWAYGKNQRSLEKGFFPMTICHEIGGKGYERQGLRPRSITSVHFKPKP